MGRKGSWFSAVKKAFSAESKKDQKNQKSKLTCCGYHGDLEPAHEEAQAPTTAVAPPLPPTEDVKATEAENEQNKHALSLAFATAVATEAAVAAAQAAAEVIRLTSLQRYPGKTLEEIAAIKIQTAFRRYLARRTLHALRGLARLRTLIQGQPVKRQAVTTLQCMQTLTRLQSQIRERRIRMSDENQALQRQLQQKHEKEFEKLQAAVGEEWDDSSQSKEQIEAKLLKRQEAAVRRERALAYASSHQQTWKNPSSKSTNPTFMNPNSPRWGWSWLERWMASRPWEGQSSMYHNDHASLKSAASNTMSVGELTKLYYHCDQTHDSKPSPAGQKATRPRSHNSPSAPASKASCLPSANAKARRSSPKGGDDDSRSTFSVQSKHKRRHSISGSSLRDDDESLPSSPGTFPNHMTPTKATPPTGKARSKMQSSSSGVDRKGTPEKGAAAVSAKKRLSLPASPVVSRRHSSGPTKVEVASKK